MDKLGYMKTFCAVAELRSFSRASLQLGITAPLVSRQVSALEKHLGIRLFNRSTRVVELSEAGERYYPRALELIEQLDQLESDVGDLGRKPGGLLRVSVPMDFGRLFLGQALREFLSLHPAIQLQVTYEDRQAQLIEEGVDAAIRIGRLTDSSLVARKLGSACIACFASPDYLQAHGMPEKPADLERHKLLEYSLSSTPRQWRFDRSEEVIDIAGLWRFSANNGRALAEMASRGLGIMRAPEFLVQDFVADGRLVEVLQDWRSEPASISLLYLDRKFKPVKITTLADFLSDWFARRSDWLPSRA
jgi:DNA-binding transcriptional LysR family regulator